MNNEIVIYQPNIQLEKIEVRIDNDTVWLNRHQISVLFERDIKTIGKHINNALKEELEGTSTVAKFATVQMKLAGAFFTPITQHVAIKEKTLTPDWN